MLSSEDKTRIELEETYRHEIAARLQTRSKTDLVETVIKMLQGLAIIAGIWATWYAYRQQVDAGLQQEKERTAQTAREFRRSFYEKQLQYYAEASEAAATLATEQQGSPDYVLAHKHFDRLFWGRLSIVEDANMETRMISFKNLLYQYEQNTASVTDSVLQQASLDLAHEASRYIINIWLDSTERRNYNR